MATAPKEKTRTADPWILQVLADPEKGLWRDVRSMQNREKNAAQREALEFAGSSDEILPGNEIRIVTLKVATLTLKENRSYAYE